MERIVWLVIMIPLSAFFTLLGVYAWRRKKPMWFWAGSEIGTDEISDVPAYNRANGIMWITYSLIFWFGTIFGFFKMNIGGIITAAGSLGGIPILIIVYKKIYASYRTKR